MKKYLGEIILIVVAILFGMSYLFQTTAAYHIGPFLFGTMRYIVSSLCLFPFIFKRDGTKIKDLLLCGLFMGFLLFVASAFQQFAAGKTESGKLGFITSLYIVMVPLIKKFVYKKRIGKDIFLAIVLAVVGLVNLCSLTSLSFNHYDLLLLVSAFAYAIEIIYVDKMSNINPMKFMFVSSFGAFIFFVISALLFETIEATNIRLSLLPILYVGVASGAVGYTFQAIGQRYVDETRSSLIMSFESIISVITGFIFLNEVLTVRELFGCSLMFLAILICVKSKN